MYLYINPRRSVSWEQLLPRAGCHFIGKDSLVHQEINAPDDPEAPLPSIFSLYPPLPPSYGWSAVFPVARLDVVGVGTLLAGYREGSCRSDSPDRSHPSRRIEDATLLRRYKQDHQERE